jgi:hypothetical protein
MEMQLLRRVEEVDDKVSAIAVSVAKMEGVAEVIRDHETRMKRLESWQARLIGGYIVAAALIGVALQFAFKAMN